MLNKQEMINIYKQYGFDMPLKAKYKRDSNRIYTSIDFQDGEEIEFLWNCEHPSACSIGNAFYRGKDGLSHLINIKELELIS
jgi:hypothetical protein